MLPHGVRMPCGNRCRQKSAASSPRPSGEAVDLAGASMQLNLSGVAHLLRGALVLFGRWVAEIEDIPLDRDCIRRQPAQQVARRWRSAHLPTVADRALGGSPPALVGSRDRRHVALEQAVPVTES